MLLYRFPFTVRRLTADDADLLKHVLWNASDEYRIDAKQHEATALAAKWPMQAARATAKARGCWALSIRVLQFARIFAGYRGALRQRADDVGY